jgi:hypothetical protein
MWHAWERGETCTGFWWESPKGKDHFKGQGIDGIRMDLMEFGSPGGGGWRIHLAWDRDRWRALVNSVTNRRVLAPRY